MYIKIVLNQVKSNVIYKGLVIFLLFWLGKKCNENDFILEKKSAVILFYNIY